MGSTVASTPTAAATVATPAATANVVRATIEGDEDALDQLEEEDITLLELMESHELFLGQLSTKATDGAQQLQLQQQFQREGQAFGQGEQQLQEAGQGEQQLQEVRSRCMRRQEDKGSSLLQEVKSRCMRREDKGSSLLQEVSRSRCMRREDKGGSLLQEVRRCMTGREGSVGGGEQQIVWGHKLYWWSGGGRGRFSRSSFVDRYVEQEQTCNVVLWTDLYGVYRKACGAVSTRVVRLFVVAHSPEEDHSP